MLLNIYLLAYLLTYLLTYCFFYPLNVFPLATRIRLLLTIVRVYKLYLLTYFLLTYNRVSTSVTSCDDTRAISDK